MALTPVVSEIFNVEKYRDPEIRNPGQGSIKVTEVVPLYMVTY